MEAYRYSISCMNGGIVMADSKDDAFEKLRSKYGAKLLLHRETLVWKATDDDYYDPDCPDVYECY